MQRRGRTIRLLVRCSRQLQKRHVHIYIFALNLFRVLQLKICVIFTNDRISNVRSQHLRCYLELGVVCKRWSELSQPRKSHVRVSNQSRPVLIDVRRTWRDDGEAAQGQGRRRGDTKIFSCVVDTGSGRRHAHTEKKRFRQLPLKEQRRETKERRARRGRVGGKTKKESSHEKGSAWNGGVFCP